jgi:hypothetical protein
MIIRTLFVLGIALLTAGCSEKEQQVVLTEPGTFGYDVHFLKQHTDALVLQREDAAIVVVPEYQGRVMTASARGYGGSSSGWINYEIVEQGILTPAQQEGKLEEHIMAFGGEERFWMGPEGGQYAIFFEPGVSYDFENWFTPDPIDNEPWQITAQGKDVVVFNHEFDLQNHSGTKFRVGVERTIKLMEPMQVGGLLGTFLPESVDVVGYQTVNTLKNMGEEAWEEETGLLSIWLLCMFKHSDTTTVFIPYKQNAPGAVVNADYFGKVPPDRLQAKDGVIYFKCDGKQRGKIGVSPERSMGIAGSYDPEAGRLTLVVYHQPEDYIGYVNSMWAHQDQPYKGDAINSYNDGPVGEDGEQIGPFYEIETSSPAIALMPMQSATHSQSVVHLYGEEAQLQEVVSAVADVDLATVKSVLP